MNLRLPFIISLVVFAGCRREQPPTVVPPAPAIESFTVSASTATPGQSVTLSWKVLNATSIELREATAGALPVAADVLEGTLAVSPTVTSLYVLTAQGPSGTDARAVAVTVPPGAGNVTFQALPSTIPGGDSTTLVWLAPGAQQVELSAGGQAVDLQGQRSAGAVTVRPLADTLYTLTVDGQVLTAMVTVQAAILRFGADRMAVEAGDPLTLSWDTAGATRVILSSEGRGVLLDSTTAATVRAGSFADTAPVLPVGGVLAYELVVEKGTASASRTLEVFVGTGLTIVRLDTPPVAARGGVYSVRWTTLAADQVEVRVDGATAFVTANTSQALFGSFTFPTPMNDFGLELIATNARGARAARTAQVDVVGVPTGVTLSATPATVAAGASTTLTWASTEARRVRITDDDGQPVFSLTGQGAEAGSVAVFPNRASTTYTISADNLLGSTVVTATATVTVTGPALSLFTSPPTVPTGGRLSLAASQPDALLVGFPHAQVLTGTRADFLDIRGTGQQLDITTTPGVIAVDVPFSTWLWGQRQTGLLTVSRAGWMAWGAALAVDSSESVLPSTSAAPFILAPFWDNLTITAASSVHFQVVDAAPNERLIVQWSRLQVGTDVDTELTFQVQVHQEGAVSFQYRDVTLAPAYTSFEVGVQDGTQKLAITPDFVPESDTALYFFGPVMANADVQVVRGSKWGGFLQRNGVSSLVARDAVAVSMPEDLAVTEVLFRPAATVSAGQYVELVNRTLGPLDLSGWNLTAPSGSRFDFPQGFTLQPDVPFVLGASDDAAENDDAGVQLSWADAGFVLPTDAGSFFVGAGDGGFNLVFAPDGGAGKATVVDPGFFRVGTSSLMRLLVCNAVTPFGGQAPQQLGNPGQHSGCGFGYRVLPIAEHYVDITASGTSLVNSPAAAVTALTVPITLAATAGDPAPLVFGNRTPVVSMSIDGWLALESLTTVNATNKTTPGTTTAPRGLVAPFWDDLQTSLGLTPESDLYWKRMAAGEDAQRPEPHWIFQWHRLRHLSTAPADDLNFQVKLFEDGTIEYHYGELRSGTTTNYGNGNSATVWLERSDAGVAITLSANTADVKPHTAWRFVPQ
ncbi:MAG: lamin tail domain-containing protein [Archangium sp.]|nr:lamin tail domain-containing protein [Archangium sp.]